MTGGLRGGGVARSARTVLRRLRAYGPSLLLAAAAAGLAFGLAALAFGPQNAVFAPVAAVVATGLSAGRRRRRAVEISGGVVLGVVAADLLVRALGIGPLQLALAVAIAMALAVALRPSQLMVNQAAVAAVVVMALVPYLDAGPWVRLGDAVIGGAVAVALNAVASPDPYRAARTTTDQVLREYAAVLRGLAGAVAEGALPVAERSLADMTSLDGAWSEISDAVAATRERVVLRGEDRRRRRESLRAVEGIAGRVVIMLATGRALSRAVANLVRHRPGVGDPELAGAVDHLADAIESLRTSVLQQAPVDGPRGLALDAAARASATLPGSHATAVLVGQLRSASVDVLRATGMSQDDAVAALEAAAGRADELGAG